MKIMPQQHIRYNMAISALRPDGTGGNNSYGPALDVPANAYPYSSVQSFSTPVITANIARMMYYHPQWNFLDCKQRLRQVASHWNTGFRQTMNQIPKAPQGFGLISGSTEYALAMSMSVEQT